MSKYFLELYEPSDFCGFSSPLIVYQSTFEQEEISEETPRKVPGGTPEETPQETSEDAAEEFPNEIRKTKIKKTPRKSLERKISDVVNAVYNQRRYYYDQKQQGNHIRLKDAAIYAGMNKKSLDDYLYVIKQAHGYKYDFHSNRNKGFGAVRQFVHMKNSEKKANGK